MTRRLLALLGVLALAATACGGGDAGNSDSDPSDDPVTPSTTVSVSELLAAGTMDGRFTVTGYLFIDTDGNAVLCEAIAESYPPQCGGQSIDVAGDIPMLDDLTTDQGLRWSDNPVELEGTFDGTTFTTA
jgi:hypothetical protein